MAKNKLIIFIFSTPDVHRIVNSFSWICFRIKIVNAKRKDKGINLGNTPKIFKKEYLKYISVEYPLSTIKSKKFTAFTVQAIIVRPNKMTKNVLSISLMKFW